MQIVGLDERAKPSLAGELQQINRQHQREHFAITEVRLRAHRPIAQACALGAIPVIHQYEQHGQQLNA